MAELLSKEPLSIGSLLDQVFRIAVAAFTAVIPFALVGAIGSLFVNGIQYGDKFGAALGVGALATPGLGLKLVAGLVCLAADVFLTLAYLGGLCRVYEVATDTPPPSRTGPAGVPWRHGGELRTGWRGRCRTVSPASPRVAPG